VVNSIWRHSNRKYLYLSLLTIKERKSKWINRQGVLQTGNTYISAASRLYSDCNYVSEVQLSNAITECCTAYPEVRNATGHYATRKYFCSYYFVCKLRYEYLRFIGRNLRLLTHGFGRTAFLLHFLDSGTTNNIPPSGSR